eukprot:m.145859 g.145859  ORF g.145859 m.145859 type:complete len:66 (+) comp38432_c1_seq44:643-840(+)
MAPDGWKSCKTKGSAKQMSYHAAVVHEREVVTFGGTTPVGKTGPDDYVDELHRLNISKGWSATPT